MFDLNLAASAMLECAIWASTDDLGEPLDYAYSADDLTPASRAALIGDLTDFVEGSAEDVIASGLTADQVGHDFWLTRNGHGAGFWDRGIGEVGERLTAACKPFGAVDLLIGDDDLIHAH
jgi:hypothetical protein